MKCQDIKHLLYLKEHELSEHEKQLLNHHLKECKNCSDEYRTIFKVLEKIDILRQKPQIKQAETLTAAILHEIDEPRVHHHLKLIITSSWVRKSLSVAAFLLLGLFLYQQIEIMQKLEELDTKIEHHVPQTDTKIPNAHKGLIKYLPKQHILDLMNSPEFEQLIVDYQATMNENHEIYQYLQEYHPDIYQEMIDNIHTHKKKKSHENDL